MLKPLVTRLLEATHKSPSLFALVGPLNEKRSFERRVVRPSDDVLLEGYPRSANTFATQAFRLAQSGPMRIGNHFHSPMQFYLAKRYGVPAGAFFRDPLEAALSLVVYYNGQRSADWALRRYIVFYSSILKLEAGWIPISMQEATGPMEVWVRRLNRIFSTRFEFAPYSTEWSMEVKAAVEKKRRARSALNGDQESSLARQTTPSDHKKRLQNAARSQFDEPSLRPLCEDSMAVFREMEAVHRKYLAEES